MPSAADRPPSGRRIFSRIASPFSSTRRNVAELSVKPTDEHRKYASGDIVTGHVRLRVTKPIRITHIVVCLHGFVQVYKTPGATGESVRANTVHSGTGSGKKSGEYFGNGYLSLFEDEVVLCGEGRLVEGEYQFNFELEFPDRSLPSSIDFERGTISYMITATLTRAHAITPTMSCDRKIYFAESIDIAPLYPPKARTITLEPLSKRSRARNSARKLVDASEKSQRSNSAQPDGNTLHQTDASPNISTQTSIQSPGSPVLSETSLPRPLSEARRLSLPDSESHESSNSTPTPSESGKAYSGRISLVDKVITTTIESQAGGCLQGDHIHVKVNISHTKQLQSVYGIIVTLFRQARVDMRPAIPLGPIEKGSDAKYEDYYPKSLTGLGGLSLSGAGSTHVFRKDLSQSLAPLYVDSQSLATEVNAKVRVPEEAFPTIATVPGAMISFKYYVEVIVDIQGKLHGQAKSATNLSGQAPPIGHHLDSEVSDMERSAFTPFGSTVIDTASVRRDKGVVTCTFEVVVGTKDSERRKGKRKLVDVGPDREEPSQQAPTQDGSDTNYYEGYPTFDWYGYHGYYDQQWHEGYYPHYYYPQEAPPPPPPVPIPQVPDEAELTEKERIQQAETRLLPSQPPGMEDESDAVTSSATAPFIPGERVVGAVGTSLPAAPEYTPQPSSSRTPNPIFPPDLPPPDLGQRELPHEELRAEAVEPQDHENDQSVPGAAPPNDEPTAPSLDDIEGSFHDSHAGVDGATELPRYE